MTISVVLKSNAVSKDKCECFKCGRQPHEILEYKNLAKELNNHEKEQNPEKPYYFTPFGVVRSIEGTFDSSTNFFTCTNCHLILGAPMRSTLFSLYKRKRRKNI